MQVCGIICEYNPFHSGHALHLERARGKSGADYIICVMSGALTQRGTFARYDKWTRARMALEGGADLVIELPVRFACAPAPEFAAGGVSLLDALGVVTHLSFGCEAESLPLLVRAAQVLSDESDAFRQALRENLSRGLLFPRARAMAAEAVLNMPGLEAAISRPNAALAVEYLRALPEHITPVPVVREGCGYHDETLGELSSATAIRAAVSQGRLDAALSSVPCPGLLRDAEARGMVHEEDALTTALLYRLRTMTPGTLAGIAGVEEGLEHRLITAAKSAATRDALILTAKSRRYTYARLSRICAAVLLDMTQDFADANRTPAYARVLGFKKSAQPLLRAVKDSASIPLITKAADHDLTDPLFALDVRAQDLWSLGCSAPSHAKAGLDYLTSPVIL